jgi:hypothetical protein
MFSLSFHACFSSVFVSYPTKAAAKNFSAATAFVDEQGARPYALPAGFGSPVE